MRIYDYLMLSEKEQMNKIIACGSLVQKLHLTSSSFVLYGINDFFVEIEYLHESNRSKQESVVLSRNIFKSGARLEKYLQNV